MPVQLCLATSYAGQATSMRQARPLNTLHNYTISIDLGETAPDLKEKLTNTYYAYLCIFTKMYIYIHMLHDMHETNVQDIRTRKQMQYDASRWERAGRPHAGRGRWRGRLVPRDHRRCRRRCCRRRLYDLCDGLLGYCAFILMLACHQQRVRVRKFAMPNGQQWAL